MSLDIQLITLFVSFAYGVFLYFVFLLNSKILYNDKLFIKIMGSFLLVLDGVLLYFIILLRINNGICHPYCLILLSIGFYLTYRIVKKVKK